MHILLFFILIALIFPGLIRFLFSLVGLAVLCIIIVAAAHASDAGSQYKRTCISSLDGKRSHIMAKCEQYVEEPDEYSCEFRGRRSSTCYIEHGCYTCAN